LWTVLLQAFVANIADLCPEYCANITIELLQEAASPEAQLLALRSLLLPATSVPQDAASALNLPSTVRRSSALHPGGSSSSSMPGCRGCSKRMVTVSVLG
jgi:hypothetical protein